jgi:hypothetical protein
MKWNKSFLEKADEISKDLGTFYIDEFIFAWIEKHGTKHLLPKNAIAMKIRQLENITTFIDREFNAKNKMRSDIRLYTRID